MTFRTHLQHFAHTPPSQRTSRTEDTMQGNNNGKITGIGRVRKAATASPSPSKQPSTKAEDKEDAVVAKPSRNRSPLKRSLSAVSQEEYESGSPTPGKKKRRSKREKSQNDEYYPENNLVDSLRPGLILVMIGLNPGLTTAKTGKVASIQTVKPADMFRTCILSPHQPLLAFPPRKRHHAQASHRR